MFWRSGTPEEDEHFVKDGVVLVVPQLGLALAQLAVHVEREVLREARVAVHNLLKCLQKTGSPHIGYSPAQVSRL